MEITAGMVRDLREKTGAGMMDCKKALTESGGDFAKAEEWLRKKGISKAASKGTRVAAEGLLGYLCTPELGVLAEVNCETDFVARNPDFLSLVADTVEHVGKHNPADLPVLFTQSWVKNTSMKVQDVLSAAVAKIGENITVRRFARFAPDAKGTLGGYLHGDNRKAALVELSAASESAAKNPEAVNLAKELAMQSVASKPQYVSREQVPAEVLAKETETYKDELKLQRSVKTEDGTIYKGVLRSETETELNIEVNGRLEKLVKKYIKEVKATTPPENMWDKILVGKVEKFYEAVCLIDQIWVKDDKKKIKQVIAEASKAAGGELTVKRFVRFEVGEGIEKKKDDLAAEVAKTLGQA